MEHNYLIHTKDGNKVYMASELINNAKAQRDSGLKPSYSFHDHNHPENDMEPGYLVYSTIEDGCAVVILRGDTGHVITGWQGDFCIKTDDKEPNT